MTPLIAVLLAQALGHAAAAQASPPEPTTEECASLVQRARGETLAPAEADRMWLCYASDPQRWSGGAREGFIARQPPPGADLLDLDPVTPWILMPDVTG